LDRKNQNWTKMASALDLQKQADVCRNSGKTHKAIELYKKAFKLFENDGNFERAGHAIQMIGVSYKIDNDSKNTLVWLKKARRYYEKYNLTAGVGNTLRDIGIIWEYNKKYSEAKKHIEESIKVLKNTNDLAGYGVSVAKLGLVHISMKKYELSEKEIKKSIKILEKTDNWFFLATAWGHLGELYLSMKKYEKTIEALEVSMRIFDAKKQKHIMTRRYTQGYGMLANAYANLGELNKAKKYLAKSKKLIEDFTPNAKKIVLDDIKAEETENTYKT